MLSHLYVRNPKWDCGRLTAENAALVGNQFLAWMATDRLSVYKYVIEFLIWGRSCIKSGCQDNMY